MPKPFLIYIRGIDAMNRFIGRIAMYLIFALVGVLLWSSINKVAFSPTLWTLETAQFIMVGYYVLGGPYSIQLGSNVRMDLFYGSWSIRRRAWTDAMTVFFLIFYLGVLLWGGISSTAYSLGHFSGEPFKFFAQMLGAFFAGGPEAALAETGHLERSASVWRPYMWPVKTVMCFGIFLMLLQALSELCKDILRIRGHEI